MMDVVTAPPPRTTKSASDQPPSRPANRSDDGDRADGGDALVVAADRLRLASTRLARILRRETHTGLTPTQGAALATLQRLGPVPLGVLAEAEGISAPTATKVVDKLVRAELVQRQAHPDDRRVSLVVVTRAGHELLADTRRHKTEWLATRLGTLNAADQRKVVEALEMLERLVAPEVEPPETGRDSTDPRATRRPRR